MNIELSVKKTNRFQWKSVLVTVALVLSSAGLIIKMLPESYEMVLFGLYSIPSHMLISLFPHEPYLLLISKYASPLTISLVATAGCCIAGFLDYKLLFPLLNHKSLRPKLEKNNFYQKCQRFFRKSPFLLLVGAALSPVPFYPIKFISIAGNYPLWKYQLALFVGRTPRFYLLALLGNALQVPTWVLITLLVVLMVLPLVQKFKRKKPVLEEEYIEDVIDNELFLHPYEDILNAGEREAEPEPYRSIAN